MPPLLVRFCGRADNAGGPEPQWRITSSSSVKGEGLASAETLSVVESSVADSETQSLAGTVWAIRGTTSNTRYTTKEELAELVAKQEGLGRAKATNAALIFIKKSESWWSLPQGACFLLRRARRTLPSRDAGVLHVMYLDLCCRARRRDPLPARCRDDPLAACPTPQTSGGPSSKRMATLGTVPSPSTTSPLSPVACITRGNLANNSTL